MKLKTREQFKRARSDGERMDRRASIMAAAEKILLRDGFDTFTMSGLAKNAGLAKGTTYLYFETKNDLLFALFTEKFTDWRDQMIDQTRKGISDRTFCQVFLKTGLADPLFLPLATRLTTTIEQKETAEHIVEIKRNNNEILKRLIDHLCDVLDLKVSQSRKLVWALITQLMGSALIDVPLPLTSNDTPNDVQKMLNRTSIKKLFSDSAQLVMAGIRAQ